MSEYITEPVARIAARWWGSKIEGHGSRHDNGDITFGSIYAGMLADMSTEEADDEKVNRFIDFLAESIVERNKESGREVTLDCDYHPCTMLLDCAEKAEINKNNFPWKTSMRISPDKIVVSNGYGQPWEVIWKSKA